VEGGVGCGVKDHWFVGGDVVEAKVGCEMNVTNDVLEEEPMVFAWVVGKSCEGGYRKGDVRTCSKREVE